MNRLSLQVRLFLLVAAALTLAMALALLRVREGGAGPAQWYATPIIVLAYLAALAVCRVMIGRWCAALRSEEAAMPPAGRSRNQDAETESAERDHMLREIHHRVRNNLQMISSLLSFQADRIRSPRIRRIFAGAQNRVFAMSIVHRHLYERSNWAQVDFQAFLNDLVRHLSADHGAQDKQGVRFDVRAPVLVAGPDIAIPVGLIVTEAVSNALAHAFAATTDPQVTIRARQVEGTFELSIEDNGSGIRQSDEASAEQNGLGFTLFRGLSAQLGGDLDVANRTDGGTCVRVRFSGPAVADVDELNNQASETAHERRGEAGRSSAPA